MCHRRIRVCRVCGDPFDAFSDDDYCGQCSARRAASFEVRKLSITARIIFERAQAKLHRDNNPANKQQHKLASSKQLNKQRPDKHHKPP